MSFFSKKGGIIFNKNSKFYKNKIRKIVENAFSRETLLHNWHLKILAIVGVIFIAGSCYVIDNNYEQWNKDQRNAAFLFLCLFIFMFIIGLIASIKNILDNKKEIEKRIEEELKK